MIRAWVQSLGTKVAKQIPETGGSLGDLAGRAVGIWRAGSGSTELNSRVRGYSPNEGQQQMHSRQDVSDARLSELSLPADSQSLFEADIKATRRERCPTIEAVRQPGERFGDAFLRITGVPLIVTIDGLAAYGKGSVAKFLARYLEVPEMSSGLAYRAGAYLCKHELKPLRERSFARRRDEERKTPVLTAEEQELVISTVTRAITEGLLFVKDGVRGSEICLKRGRRTVNITDKLLTHEFAQGASILGEIGEVREALKPFLVSFFRSGGVTDGRDMGVVLAKAPVKFFFGDPNDLDRIRHAYVRAMWRVRQWEALGQTSKLEGVPNIEDWIRDPKQLAQFDADDLAALRYVQLLTWSTDGLLDRDEHDMNRKVAPLQCPEDAISYSPIASCSVPPVDDPRFIPREERVDEDGVLIDDEKVYGMRVRSEREVQREIAFLADARIEAFVQERLATKRMDEKLSQ
jgi:cytidylate kinase